MKILIVSGFLGAGKTTFIKELIRRSGVSPVVLENEYGEDQLDSRELGRLGDLKILEFMEGCVCCTKKDSFANTILAISAGLDPEYLVVEPTGVGKLGSIIENIRRISYEKIQLLKSVVVLSPGSFSQNMARWPEIYTDQLVNADTVVFSKVEQELPERIQAVAEQIRARNPRAEILMTHYRGQPTEWWKSLLEIERGSQEAESVGGEAEAVSQFSLKEAGLSNVGELISLLEDTLRGRFGDIPRAKGVLRVGEEMLRYDLADGSYLIGGAPAEETKTQCVFIGREIDKKDICDRLHTSLRENRTYIRKMSPTRRGVNPPMF